MSENPDNEDAMLGIRCAQAFGGMSTAAELVVLTVTVNVFNGLCVSASPARK